METMSLPLLWFEEKCQIRLFDIPEKDFEHKVQLGFPVGTVKSRSKPYASQAKNSCWKYPKLV